MAPVAPFGGGQPPKKKRSTLTIVLSIIGGGLLLLAIVVGIGIYLVLSSPKGRAIVGVMGDAVKISAKAKKAPGTKELRAMGCKDAMVVDLADFAKMAEYFDAGAAFSSGEDGFGEMVVCSVNPWGTPPSCERVANTYVGAVGTRSKPFIVSVQQTGSKKACTGLYDGSATEMTGSGDDVPSMPEFSDE